MDTPSGPITCREHRLYAVLPQPGSFLHEVTLVKEHPGAMVCDVKGGEPMSLTLSEETLSIRVKVPCHIIVAMLCAA